MITIIVIAALGSFALGLATVAVIEIRTGYFWQKGGEIWWRAAVPRHQTLGAALGWSHRMLSAGEQMVFRRLIRDVTCRLLPGDHRDAQSAKTVGQLANVGSASPSPPAPAPAPGQPWQNSRRNPGKGSPRTLARPWPARPAEPIMPTGAGPSARKREGNHEGSHGYHRGRRGSRSWHRRGAGARHG